MDLANSLQLPNDVMTNVAGPNVPVRGAWWNFQGKPPVIDREADNDKENLHELI